MAMKPCGMSDEAFEQWTDCAVPTCTNKCCLSLGSKYCWPHTPGDAETARRALMETEFRDTPTELAHNT